MGLRSEETAPADAAPDVTVTAERITEESRAREVLELFRKADHIRIFFLILVEDETSFTVERLQVGFYAGGFFRFLLFIGTDIDPFAFFLALCFKKGAENLLEERVLE